MIDLMILIWYSTKDSSHTPHKNKSQRQPHHIYHIAFLLLLLFARSKTKQNINNCRQHRDHSINNKMEWYKYYKLGDTVTQKKWKATN